MSSCCVLILQSRRRLNRPRFLLHRRRPAGDAGCRQQRLQALAGSQGSDARRAAASRAG